MQPPDQARVLMDHSIIAAYAGRRWKKLLLAATTIRHLTQKKTFSLCLPHYTLRCCVFFMFFPQLRFDSVLIFQRHLRQTFAIWKN